MAVAEGSQKLAREAATDANAGNAMLAVKEVADRVFFLTHRLDTVRWNTQTLLTQSLIDESQTWDAITFVNRMDLSL